MWNYLLLLLQLRRRRRIQRISRAPIYRTRWEHRALYNSWWLNSLYSNVHPLEMKINHPKGASGPRRYVIKNGQNAVLSRRGTPSLSVYNYIHRVTPLRGPLGNAATRRRRRKRVVSSVSEETSVLITHSVYCCALSHACVHRPLQVALENRRRRSHRWKQNTAYTQSRFSVGYDLVCCLFFVVTVFFF